MAYRAFDEISAWAVNSAVHLASLIGDRFKVEKLGVGEGKTSVDRVYLKV